MKLTSLLTPILGLFTWTASAIPLEERTDQPVQTVRLTFHGGPASYNLTFPADGQLYKTSTSTVLCRNLVVRMAGLTELF